MPKALDITGQRFGKLVAISKAQSRKGKTYWLCQCDCGNTKEIQTGHLTSGAITSCGCQSLKYDHDNKIRYCEICGKQFEIIDKGWTRKYCYDCAPHEDENMSHAESVSIKRRAIKKALIEYKGCKCERCGYNKCIRALEFHHLDPNQKDFGIANNMTTKSMTLLKQEVDKCILVCSNCHAEIHEELYNQGILKD